MADVKSARSKIHSPEQLHMHFPNCTTINIYVISWARQVISLSSLDIHKIHVVFITVTGNIPPSKQQ